MDKILTMSKIPLLETMLVHLYSVPREDGKLGSSNSNRNKTNHKHRDFTEKFPFYFDNVDTRHYLSAAYLVNAF